MDFRVLGSLEVSTDDGPLSLGGRKQRLVLAHLIVRANNVVPTDVLIDEVWGEEPPDSVRSTLQGYVSHLRRALGEQLEGRTSGYVLHVHEGELDAASFEAMVKDAKKSVTTDRAKGAATFTDALALWRGNLAPIGITVEIEELPSHDYVSAVYRDQGPEIDLIGAAGETWYPYPAVFLYDMLNSPTPTSWLPKAVLEQVIALFALPDAEQQAAASKLADTLATEEVPIAAIWSGAVPTLLSPNLGCRVFPPFGYGVSLAALCPNPAA